MNVILFNVKQQEILSVQMRRIQEKKKLLTSHSSKLQFFVTHHVVRSENSSVDVIVVLRKKLTHLMYVLDNRKKIGRMLRCSIG